MFSLIALHLGFFQWGLSQFLLLPNVYGILNVFWADWFSWVGCTKSLLQFLGWLFRRFSGRRFLSLLRFFTWHRFFTRHNFRSVHSLHRQFYKTEFFLKLCVLLGQLIKQTLVVCLFKVHRFLHVRDCSQAVFFSEAWCLQFHFELSDLQT